MADKSIFDLQTQSTFGNEDRLVIGNYANNDARTITGAQMVAQLTALADGHGGISSITAVESTADAGTNVITVTMADGSTASFNVKNGSKGSTGLQTRVWIRYAHVQPTQNSDMGTTPDEWIGIATNTSSSAPSSYTSYTWYKYKGEKGDTGEAATISVAPAYRYAYSATQTTPSTWYSTVSAAASAYGDTQGAYLYTRTTYGFNDGTTVTQYSIAYQGSNGTGIGTVKAASYNGNVYNSVDTSGTLALSNIVASVSYNGTVYNSVDSSGNLALPSIQAQHTSLSITIATSDWNNGTCTKTATGVTSSNTVIVSPASASYEAYGEAQVRATAQGANQLTFTCTDVPSSSLTVNVAILN